MVEDRQISAEFEGLSHGINPERIIDTTINSMMICPMCEHIFWNPQTCLNPDCGRTLCEPCLKRAVEERETCEECLQTTKYDLNPFFVKSFKNLTFRCQNHPKCSETLTYKDLPYHICRHGIQAQGVKIEEIQTQGVKIEAQTYEIEAQGLKIISLEQENETQKHQIVSLEHKIASQDNKIIALENIIEDFKPQIVKIKPKYI